MERIKVSPGPPYNEEVNRLLPRNLEALAPSDKSVIAPAREFFSALGQSALERIQSDASLICTERVIPGPAGDLKAVILRPAQPRATTPGKQPGIYYGYRSKLTAGDR